MKHIALAAAAACSIVAGCAVTTPEHNYQAREHAISWPAPNEVHEAQVGEEILREGRETIRDLIYVPAALQVSMYTVAPGYYKKIGQNDQGEYFTGAGGIEGGAVTAMSMADQPQALLVERDGGALCVVTVFNFSFCERPTAVVTHKSAEGYVRKTRSDAGTGAARALVFGGIADGRLVLTYRQDGTAVRDRTEYDLAASPLVNYRGARIEVLAATPRAIRYRVLQNFPAR